MEGNNFSGAKTWITIVVLVVLVGAIVYFVQGNKEYEKTLVEGVTGIQGVVVSVDVQAKQFTLDQKKVLKNDDGTFAVEEKTYVVSWNDSTIFKTYNDVASLNTDASIEANIENLAQYKNVIVSPLKLDRKNSTISAKEIRILPDLTN